MAGRPGRVPDASVRIPWAARSAVGLPAVSVKAPHVAERRAWGPEMLAMGCLRPDDLKWWSLGEANAEAETGEE